MKCLGFFPDDILIVDRAIEPRHNKIVIASVDGDMTVKRLFCKNGRIELHPEKFEFEIMSFTHDGIKYLGRCHRGDTKIVKK